MAKKVKIYSYPKCSTCKKALKYLDAKGVDYQLLDITETPPSKTELKSMITAYDGELRKVFNTSGVVYREMKLSAKMPTITQSEAVTLLSANGKLVKRPFLIVEGNSKIVGFKEDEWKSVL